MKTVKATREGLTGGKTSSGYVIDTVVSFVALPAVRALHKHVLVTNPITGLSCIAEVLDVGPWNEHDDAYVFGEARPLAEQGINVSQNGKTNGAGIDLGERVWRTLGMKGNGLVTWEFLHVD